VKAVIRHLVNLLLWPLPPTRLFRLRRLLLAGGGVAFADGARMCGRGWVYGVGEFSVGRESWLSQGVTVYTHPDAPVRIGDRCDIGPEVRLVTGGHEPGPPTRRAGPGIAQPIVIGDGCWIGAGVTILGGVTIGKGAVVAAGAVVRSDVPPDSLVAGVPATLRKTF